MNTHDMTELTTPDYEVTLLDKSDVAIPGSVLDSLVLTLYQEYTKAIVNGRDKQNVLQLNGVTVDEAGVLKWTLSKEDTAILDDRLYKEPHIALFEYTFPGVGGTEEAKHTVRFLVENFERVP